MTRLGGVRRAASVVRILPARLGEWLYDRIALNRYALFGRTETCVMPDASWRDRVIG
jgi:predicted DCC family thiol-disulfide oxidoreductase YuxK